MLLQCSIFLQDIIKHKFIFCRGSWQAYGCDGAWPNVYMDYVKVCIQQKTGLFSPLCFFMNCKLGNVFLLNTLGNFGLGCIKYWLSPKRQSTLFILKAPHMGHGIENKTS